MDDVCKGLDFCVVVKSGPSADELKNMIRRHGGNIVCTEGKCLFVFQKSAFFKSLSNGIFIYLGPKTFVVIANDPLMARVAMIIKGNKHNIAKSDWLKRALGSDKPLTTLAKFTPDDMLFATESLKNQFDAEQCDENDTEPMDLDGNND